MKNYLNRAHLFSLTGLSAFVKRIYTDLITIRGEPKQIASGFALGIFLGMLPILGIQTFIGFFIAALLRWNKIAAAIGVWITNPVTAPFLYGLNYLLGSCFIPVEQPSPFTNGLDKTSLFEIIGRGPEILMAMTMGGAIIGIPLAMIGYSFAFSAVTRYQAKLKRKLLRQKKNRALRQAAKKNRIPKKRTKKIQYKPGKIQSNKLIRE